MLTNSDAGPLAGPLCEVICMPLSLSPVGEALIVRRVGGSNQGRAHLEDMGFTPGTPVTVISSLGGNLIVRVKDARVAISRELAGRIMV